MMEGFLGDREQCERWLKAYREGSVPDIPPWDRRNLLEYLCERDGDAIDVAGQLLEAPFRPFELDEMLVSAVQHHNEQIALRLVARGASNLPLSAACANGLALLAEELIGVGARINRRFVSVEAPIHLAARSSNAAAVWPLVDAACDLTVIGPHGDRVWDLAPELAVELRAAVGERGPRWFREAQIGDVDHYVFARDGAMFGFNPNDVQTPIWTGNEDEGFGWPNTPAQAREAIEGNRELRAELEWFLPFMDKLEAEEEFSLEELGPRAPKRRPSWR